MRPRCPAFIAAAGTAALIATLCVAAPSQALTAPGTVGLPAAPFTVGIGTFPTVVATPAGGVLAYETRTNGFAFGSNRLVACTLLAGHHACTHLTELTSPIGTGALAEHAPPAIWISGPVVRIATGGDSRVGDPGGSMRVVMWTSTNGGVSFGPALDLGLTSTNYGGLTFSHDGATVYTWTNNCGCGAAVNALPTNGSLAATTTGYRNVISAADQGSTIRGGIVAMPDGSLLMTAGSSTPTVDVFRLPPGHDPLVASQWSRVFTRAGEQFQPLGGAGLVSGPGGFGSRVYLVTVRASTGAIDVAHWNGSAFVLAGSIPRGRGDVSGAVDALDRLHAFFGPVTGTDNVVTRSGNGSYAPATTVVGSSGAFSVTDSSASVIGAGGGWYVYEDGTSPARVKVVPLLLPHSITLHVVMDLAHHRILISGKVATGVPAQMISLNAVVKSTVGGAVRSTHLTAGLTYLFIVPMTRHGSLAVVVPARGYYATTASAIGAW